MYLMLNSKMHAQYLQQQQQNNSNIIVWGILFLELYNNFVALSNVNKKKTQHTNTQQN